MPGVLPENTWMSEEMVSGVAPAAPRHQAAAASRPGIGDRMPGEQSELRAVERTAIAGGPTTTASARSETDARAGAGRARGNEAPQHRLRARRRLCHEPRAVHAAG